MADNDWINGYLEAIINTGERLDGYRSDGYRSDGPAAVARSSNQNVLTAAKYFVNEVTGYDDAAIYRTWIKANASKYPQEKGNRMEYLCWRVWHVARQKKRLAWEDAQRMTRSRFGKRKLLSLKDEEFSEDLSEGEKTEAPAEPVSGGSNSSLSSMTHLEFQSTHGGPGRLYIVLISLHGLVRGDNLELGRDSDTGGQVKYVVEFARALAKMPEVYRVDLLTRQICDASVDSSYGEPTEMLSSATPDHDDQVGESSGAYIVRIPCGPRDQYIRKELLWPHIQEFVDGALAHIVNMTKVLGEQLNGGAQKIWPYVIHGHYADAGDAASLLSGSLNVPFVMTGHSLGRNKLEQLLKQNRLSREGINNLYKIQRRLEAEEYSLDAAEMVITSTKQEIEEQWGLYDGFDVTTERKLRMRTQRGLDTYGRFMPRMHVITPGMDFSSVKVQDVGIDGDVEGNPLNLSDMSSASPRGERPAIVHEIMRFFSNPHKPMILALARPDPKKNLTTLLTAFGESKKLRELANLTLVMGNRDDIETMSSSNANVLLHILKLVDKFDLYGHVAYPKHHKQNEVPDIYKLAATTKGVFINPALVEPFGLTLIEAAAHGLPIVATKNGGPVDIIKALKNGVLINPHEKEDIESALLKLMMDRKFWTECRQNGLKNIHKFSWPAHCRAYLSHVAMCRMRHPEWQDDNFVDEDTALEYERDSLTDLDANNISLRLSMDGAHDIFTWMEKIDHRHSAAASKRSNENGGMFSNGDRNRLNQGYLDTVLERGMGEDKPAETFQSKVNMFRRRKHLVVLAVDSYDESTGKPTKKLLSVIQYFFKTFRSDISWRAIGFVLSTSLTGPETVEFLSSGGISVHDFDCLICASGSELFFPILPPNDSHDPSGVHLYPDPYYKEHIEYRWGGEGLKKFVKTIPKLVVENEDTVGVLVEDGERSNSHNFAYRTIHKKMAPCVDSLRSTLRDKGYRNHVMYCQHESKLHILPLLASRSQALRYLFVRYEYDVARMFVIVGETGDTDYDELLAGTHKTIVMKGVVEGGSERLLRGPGNYTREDIVPSDSPNIIEAESDDSHAVMKAFERAGLSIYIRK